MTLEIEKKVIEIAELAPNVIEIKESKKREIVEVGVVGPQGPPGTQGALLREVPIGPINGINKIFSTSVAYAGGSTQFYLNGLLQERPDDYSETGEGEITTILAPESGDTLSIIFISDT